MFITTKFNPIGWQQPPPTSPGFNRHTSLLNVAVLRERTTSPHQAWLFELLVAGTLGFPLIPPEVFGVLDVFWGDPNIFSGGVWVFELLNYNPEDSLGKIGEPNRED